MREIGCLDPTLESELLRPDPQAHFGCIRTPKGMLPVESLKVRTHLTDLLFETRVVTQFQNPYDESLEATYIFPLPERAGVTRLTMKVKDREIEGVLKERGQARRTYQAALAKGHRAALAEEERPGVFTMSVGNIPPGETVQVHLELSGPLPFFDGWSTFRFPLVVGERYLPGSALDGPSVGVGTAPDSDRIPDASRLSPPILLPGQPNPINLELEVYLDAALSQALRLESSLHQVECLEGEDGWRIRLRPGVERLDRDFVLRVELAPERIESSFSTYQAPDGSLTYQLSVLPPALETERKAKDVFLVLDRSGSMGGWQMVAAREAAAYLIDTLDPRDRFGLLAFDNRMQWFQGESKEPNPSFRARFPERTRAQSFLRKVQARGGTEIGAALDAVRAALPEASPNRDRSVILITDGLVGAEDETLQAAARFPKDVRLYTMSIDLAGNLSLLERLAERGGGVCELVESEARLWEVLSQFQRRIQGPLVTNLRLEGLEEEAAEATPRRGLDLFPGAAATRRGRLRALPDEVTLVADLPDGSQLSRTLKPRASSLKALRTAWARARILELEYDLESGLGRGDEAEKIRKLSLEETVLSRFTAFVAVDKSEVVSEGGPEHSVTQPVERVPAQSPKKAPVARSRGGFFQNLFGLASPKPAPADLDSGPPEFAESCLASFDDDLEGSGIPLGGAPLAPLPRKKKSESVPDSFFEEELDLEIVFDGLGDGAGSAPARELSMVSMDAPCPPPPAAGSARPSAPAPARKARARKPMVADKGWESTAKEGAPKTLEVILEALRRAHEEDDAQAWLAASQDLLDFLAKLRKDELSTSAKEELEALEAQAWDRFPHREKREERLEGLDRLQAQLGEGNV